MGFHYRVSDNDQTVYEDHSQLPENGLVTWGKSRWRMDVFGRGNRTFFQEQYVKDALEIKRNGQVLDYLNGCRVHHRGCLMMDREFTTPLEVEQFVMEFTKEVNDMNSREEGKVDFTFWMDEMKSSILIL